MATELARLINDWSHENPSAEFYRFVETPEGDKKRVVCDSDYFDSAAGSDSLILFLVQNEYSSTHLDKAEKSRKDSDEEIITGRAIAAVELEPSIYGTTYHSTFDNKLYSWEKFREEFKTRFTEDAKENATFKDVIEKYSGWTSGSCTSVVQLFQQYALDNLDDRHFYESLGRNLPEFAIFRTADDYEQYYENEKKMKEFESTLPKVSLVRI
jgi:hypothetical protein